MGKSQYEDVNLQNARGVLHWCQIADMVEPDMKASPAVAGEDAPQPRKSRRAARERVPGEALVGRPYGGRSLEDRVATRRARFIEAGIALFGRQGFRATTVRGVCAEAGLTDRYFYESFDSMEDLLIAVHAAITDGLRDKMAREALSEPTLEMEDIRRRAYNAYAIWFDAVSDPRFARIMLYEMLGVSPRVDAVYEARIAEFGAMTATPLQARVLLPLITEERRAMIGRALVGGALQVAAAWYSGGYKESRELVIGTCTMLGMGVVHVLAAEVMANTQARR
jgi:AcrR family transcriptional regulator